MKTLVVWFRNGKLYKAQVCGSRSLKRVANQWNEYAKFWSRANSQEINLIGTISQAAVLNIMRRHEGLPKHSARSVLQRQKKIREFKRGVLPTSGRKQ